MMQVVIPATVVFVERMEPLIEFGSGKFSGIHRCLLVNSSS